MFELFFMTWESDYQQYCFLYLFRLQKGLFFQQLKLLDLSLYLKQHLKFYLFHLLNLLIHHHHFLSIMQQCLVFKYSLFQEAQPLWCCRFLFLLPKHLKHHLSRRHYFSRQVFFLKGIFFLNFLRRLYYNQYPPTHQSLHLFFCFLFLTHLALHIQIHHFYCFL